MDLNTVCTNKGTFVCIAQFNTRLFKVLYINIKCTKHSNKIQRNKTEENKEKSNNV